jgi:hypothetical protein
MYFQSRIKLLTQFFNAHRNNVQSTKLECNTSEEKQQKNLLSNVQLKKFECYPFEDFKIAIAILVIRS